MTWPAGRQAVGYTDAGIDYTFTHTIKKLTVDEVASPVGDILAEEAFHISCHLAEVTLQNFNYAVAAGVLTTNAAEETIQVAIGSKALQLPSRADSILMFVPTQPYQSN